MLNKIKKVLSSVALIKQIAVGLVILIAVSIDVVQQTMKERRMVKVDIKE